MEKRVKAITELLDTKKAENIEVIDMSEKEYMAKFVIIATTLTGRHALSLVDDLKGVLKPFKEKFLNIESSDEWSVIDLGDIIVHLMSETYREKYNIEEFLEKLKKEQI
ncbi:ribosome silencing factor [Campylobacter geochelonis]|nr:ribosome silencing factor [Campylobacter geochelonis]